jgi:Baseplate J-like protein
MSVEQAPVCQDEQRRRADVLASALNGIDFLEVDAADHRLLRIFFLKPVPPQNPADPADPVDAYGLHADQSRISIEGGARVVGIRPVSLTRQPDGHLELRVSEGGDFSVYTLTLDVPALDRFLRRVEFSFMASCPTRFDCRVVQVCAPAAAPEPRLDYMAKDYASFRRMLLELGPRLNPQFVETNPSDLGVALLELLAYTGDRLSYFQDAVANEAYLETVRRRISARRHARLVDYPMHDGRNAWTWVHLAVNAPAALPQGTPVVTRLSAPLAGTAALPGLVVDPGRITAEALAADPALAAAVVFETAQPGRFDPRHNEMVLHTWGDEECCVAPGTRLVFLYHVPPGGGTALLPALERGDDLLFEEVRGPVSGLPADADPAHRQVARIDEDPEPTEDPVYAAALLPDGRPRLRAGAEPALPLLAVRLRREDALRGPFCLSVRRPGGELLRNVTVARGNLVLADQGLTTEEPLTAADPGPQAAGLPLRLQLLRGPLTFEQEPDAVEHDPVSGRLATPRTELAGDARGARPAVCLLRSLPGGNEVWEPAADLLDSPPFAARFVAEVEDDGRAVLRFGDGEYGREPSGGDAFTAVYRVGNGTAGNVGSEVLAHLALPGPAPWLEAVRNPLPAVAGTAPESIEEVRRRAPEAFRAEQLRAVTEADYSAAARQLPDVADAVATFRWTGSWITVFVGVDPRDDADLVQGPSGLARLSPRLASEVRAFLSHYRLAGYDLEIRPPRFVPLAIELELCVESDHFRADVAQAVLAALGTRALPDGTLGFFHRSLHRFGQPVYLSRLYAAVARVPGVCSAVVRVFRRAGELDHGELSRGVLPIGPWEIARLDNDPSFMENGTLLVTALGGKA